MSVVVKENNKYYYFIKGAPEKVISICKKESIP